MNLAVDSEDSNQTALMRSLIRAFAVRACPEGTFSIDNRGDNLWGWDTLGRFSAILYNWDNFLDFLFALLRTYPFLNLSSLQTNTDTFANSADPDETAPTKRLIRNRHCLPFSVIETKTPICNNWCVQIQIWKSLF